jgi:hypothetical protein
MCQLSPPSGCMCPQSINPSLQPLETKESGGGGIGKGPASADANHAPRVRRPSRAVRPPDARLASKDCLEPRGAGAADSGEDVWQLQKAAQSSGVELLRSVSCVQSRPVADIPPAPSQPILPWRSSPRKRSREHHDRHALHLLLRLLIILCNTYVCRPTYPHFCGRFPRRSYAHSFIRRPRSFCATDRPTDRPTLTLPDGKPDHHHPQCLPAESAGASR